MSLCYLLSSSVLRSFVRRRSLRLHQKWDEILHCVVICDRKHNINCLRLKKEKKTKTVAFNSLTITRDNGATKGARVLILHLGFIWIGSNKAWWPHIFSLAAWGWKPNSHKASAASSNQNKPFSNCHYNLWKTKNPAGSFQQLCTRAKCNLFFPTDFCFQIYYDFIRK